MDQKVPPGQLFPSQGVLVRIQFWEQVRQNQNLLYLAPVGAATGLAISC